jgi:hypothetical protein
MANAAHLLHLASALLSVSNGITKSVAFVPVSCTHQHCFFGTDVSIQNAGQSAKLHAASDHSERIDVYEHNVEGDRFNRGIFAKSNCWGRRPFLMRGAFDVDALMQNDNDDAPWPSWEDVVDIASDEESETRCVQYMKIPCHSPRILMLVSHLGFL